MKYFEVDFNIDASEELMEDARDIVAALAGEAGFETFEETPQGLKGYIQQSLFDSDSLERSLQSYQLPGANLSFTVSEAEDKDWNEQWEQEGFEPIVVTVNKADISKSAKADTIIIHDGRHLPERMEGISIEIDAHLAFGTGNHETTQMMVANLLQRDLTNKRVLDCGCGTGILAIAALKLGADDAVGYDIDEWSVDNARHNAVINQVDNRFISIHGDASVLSDNAIEGCFDVIVANINRNILLADMPSFRKKMSDNGLLLLSGFYSEDIPLLTEKARELGLELIDQKECNDWACITLQ